LSTSPDGVSVVAHNHIFTTKGGPLAIKIDVENNGFFTITSSVSEDDDSLPNIHNSMEQSTKRALAYPTKEIATTPAWTYIFNNKIELISGDAKVGKMDVMFVKYDNNLMTITNLPAATEMYITGVK
jgi:hypothetical protein